MPLSPEQARARAQRAAHTRWHGDESPGAEAALEALGDATEAATLDRHIDELVARAPRMTAEQRDKLRRVFRYGPPDEGGAVA